MTLRNTTIIVLAVVGVMAGRLALADFNGAINQTYTFEVVANDPGDVLQYELHWGTGPVQTWPTDGTYRNSGVPVNATHPWGSAGNYQVFSVAIDDEGSRSGDSNIVTANIQPPSIPGTPCQVQTAGNWSSGCVASSAAGANQGSFTLSWIASDPWLDTSVKQYIVQRTVSGPGGTSVANVNVSANHGSGTTVWGMDEASLATGCYTYVAQAEDTILPVSNFSGISTASANVIVDQLAPAQMTAPTTPNVGGVTADPTPTWEFAPTTDNGNDSCWDSGIDYYNFKIATNADGTGVIQGPTTVDETGQALYSFTQNNSAGGIYYALVQAVDNAGTIGSWSPAGQVTISAGTTPFAEFDYCSTNLSSIVQFADRSAPSTGQTLNQWTWDFDDGMCPAALECDDQHPLHTFSSGGGPNWLAGWGRRMPIAVTNPTGGDRTNYQVKVVVPYDTDMQLDFDDLRFTDTDGTTLIDHFLENKTDSVTATFWVEIPSLPAAGTTLYAYYNNVSAASASSGSSTFVWYEGFESYANGNINGQGGWVSPYEGSSSNQLIASTAPYEGSKHEHSQASGSTFRAGKTVISDKTNNAGRRLMLEGRMRIYDTASPNPQADAVIELYDNPTVGIGADMNLGFRALVSGINPPQYWYYTAGGVPEAVSSVAINTGTYHKIQMGTFRTSGSQNQITMYVDGTLVVDDTTFPNAFDGIYRVTFYSDSSAGAYIDQLFLRQWRGPGSDPVATLGGEEMPPSSGPYDVILTVRDTGAGQNTSAATQIDFTRTCTFSLITVASPNCHSIDLVEWSHGNGANQYLVYWDNDTNPANGSLGNATVQRSSCNSIGCTYAINNLTPSTQYYVYVRAQPSGFYSNYSGCVGTQTTACPAAVETPVCEVTGIVASETECGSIAVAWPPVDQADGGYDIFRADDVAGLPSNPLNSGTTAIKLNTSRSTTGGNYTILPTTGNIQYVDRAVITRKKYSYRVFAFNGANEPSQGTDVTAVSFCFKGPTFEEK